ncbi:hypothetical protein PUN28_014656 [Cardiocondyla obscurior]|uniref:Uncharacterized protein n=1 Tax=Cardiocondyla obscurior TaxID=286306 RepID=A0AAW2EX09_9HYME
MIFCVLRRNKKKKKKSKKKKGYPRNRHYVMCIREKLCTNNVTKLAFYSRCSVETKLFEWKLGLCPVNNLIRECQ